jgi:hypothetical protein
VPLPRLTPPPAHRKPPRVVAAATAGVVAALLTASVLHVVAAPAHPEQRAMVQADATLDLPCTRILDGTEWLFDPCIPESEPLPDDVVEALQQVQWERENCSSPSPSQTTTPTSPTPSSTVPTSSAPATPTGGPSPTLATATATVLTDARAVALPGLTATATDTALPTATATATATGTATTEPTVTASPTTDPSPTWSPSPCPSPTGTASPTATPTSSSPSPTATSTPTSSPDPTLTVPPDPTPTSTPGGCVALQGGSLDDAKKDRVDCRDPQSIPDRANAIVLTATGDSVTSAHHQWGYGAGVCQRTSADNRGLVGNNGIYSYAGRYFALNPNIIDYHNMARTGFGTPEMLGAGAATTDACLNPWARGVAPVPLAAARITKAKADGHKAYHVSTGGINNTNWTSVLTQLIKCRALEFAQQTVIPRSSLNWAAVGGRAGIVTNGGGCTLRVRNLNPFAADYFHRIGVPRYDGPAQAAAITAGVTATVNAIMAAGADKFVWMLYYNINPANIDIGNFAWTYLRSIAPAWVVGYLPPAATPALVALIDPMWVGAVTGLINAMNAAIVAGIPANPKVRAQPAPAFVAGDIQVTAIGGSPHPSPAGQTKLANTLNAAFNAIP